METLLKLQPLWPAFIIGSYFLISLAYFAVRSRFDHQMMDAEVDKRVASKILGRWIRHFFMWWIGPYERAIVRAGISPNTLTAMSMLVSAGSGLAVALGHFALGGWLFIATGIFDIMDGRVARATGKVSQSGAFFDSVLDRYAEIFVFAGFTYFYRDSWVLFAVLAASLGSIMVSYSRARGEALGVDVNVGMMQRPERMAYMSTSMVTAPFIEVLIGHGPLPIYPPVVAVLVMLAISTNMTALRRIQHTMAALDRKSGVPAVALVSVTDKKVVVPASAPAAANNLVPLRAAQN